MAASQFTHENPLETAENTETRTSLTDKAKLGAAVMCWGFQQSPGNEALRAYIGTNMLAVTHDPLLVGMGIGLTTMAIEGASSLFVAEALNAHPEWMGKLKTKMKRGSDSVETTQKSNRGTDVALTLGVGSAAVVVKRHYQEADRTMQKDCRTIAKTAGGIALFSAGIGILASGGIEYADKIGLGSEAQVFLDVASSWKTYAGLFLAVQAYKGIKTGVNKLIRRNAIKEQGFNLSLTTDEQKIQKALELEQAVWHQENYGSLEPYQKYNQQSRIFTAFDGKECLGVTRLFSGVPELPPFIKYIPIDDPKLKEELIEATRRGEVEELGTIAINKPRAKEMEVPRLQIPLALWRLAYRDAYERGIKTWGIIMEPRRVRAMNRGFGFTFKQIGPETDYQGGDCAAHIMDLEEVRTHMSSTYPDLYNWFVDEPIE